MPLLVCCAAFGWESYKKGDWYKVVQSKAADFKVRALACKVPLFCVGQPASADPVRQRLCTMQAAGFTHVWLPPPSASPVSPQGYMPVSVVVEPFVSRAVQHLLHQAATPCHNRPPDDVTPLMCRASCTT